MEKSSRTLHYIDSTTKEAKPLLSRNNRLEKRSNKMLQQRVLKRISLEELLAIYDGLATENAANEPHLLAKELLKVLGIEDLAEAMRLIFKGVLQRQGKKISGYSIKSFQIWIDDQFYRIEVRVPYSKRQGPPIKKPQRWPKYSRSFKICINKYLANGVSMRSMQRIFKEQFGVHISLGTFCHIHKAFDEERTSFNERPLDPAYHFLNIDATFLTVRTSNKQGSSSRCCIAGVGLNKRTGMLESLGILMVDGEKKENYLQYLEKLVSRGLDPSQIDYITSDSGYGVVGAITGFLEGKARWQKCQFHYVKNILDLLKGICPALSRIIIERLGQIFQSPRKEVARKRSLILIRVLDAYIRRSNEALEYLENWSAEVAKIGMSAKAAKERLLEFRIVKLNPVLKELILTMIAGEDERLNGEKALKNCVVTCKEWQNDLDRAKKVLTRKFKDGLADAIQILDSPNETVRRLGRTNNLIERANKEFRRREKTINNFPDVTSAWRYYVDVAIKLNKTWSEKQLVAPQNIEEAKLQIAIP